MIILRLICPFIYSFILGSAWSLWLKKKFFNSLAPAYLVHILIVLISGLMFNRLSVGIYGGIMIAAIMLAVGLIREGKKSKSYLAGIGKWIGKWWNEGGIVFTLFYIFCLLINSNKRFIMWDEFSHWGMFLKESLRLDSLFCMSPLEFAHKDYVPAITLFETIWCKLNFRYAEPDVYTGIQVFMFSLLMPLFEKFELYSRKNTTGKQEGKKPLILSLGNIVLLFCSVAFVLLIPLVFKTNDAFCFYHSIYCDVPIGIMLYWCLFEVYKEYEDYKYTFLLLTIGVSVLVLLKMTAMALVPLVIGLFILKNIFFTEKKIKGKAFALFVPTIVIPVSLWTWFNLFVMKNLGRLDGIQSYGGMKISSVKEVFTNPVNSSIPYLKTVKDRFFDAIIHRDILIRGSYIAVIIFIVLGFFALAIFSERKNRKKISLAGVWILVSSVYYMLLMYFLYATAFMEHEAVRLASYERYMNSFVISALLFLVAVYYYSEIWRKHFIVFCTVPLLSSLYLFFLHPEVFKQVLPGSITKDEEFIKEYTDSASVIIDSTEEDDSIYIINREGDEGFLWRQRYLCNPRTIGGGSIGSKINEGDIWSEDLKVIELVDILKCYDYVYFAKLDEDFLFKYSDVFDDNEQLVEGQLYKINYTDSIPNRIKLLSTE